MGEEKKNSKNNGLSVGEHSESPFISSNKKKEEILEKLRSHNYGEYSANPDIPTRAENRDELQKKAHAQRRSESVIAQMRKNSRVIDEAEKNAGGASKGALVAAPKVSATAGEENVRETSVSEKIDVDKPRDDGYDISRVFGIPEIEEEQEDREIEEQDISEPEESFVPTKEFARLKNEFLICLPRLFLCILLALGTFLYENFEVLGIRNSVFIKIHSDVRIATLAGMQITLFGILIMIKEMWYGVKSLFKLTPQPESFLPLLATFLLVYEVASLATLYKAFASFNFLLFSVSVFCLVSKWMDLSRKLHALKVISSKSPKYSLVRMKKSESAPERKATSGIMDLSEDAKYIRVVRSKKITGYRSRTEGKMIYKRLSGVFIVASLIAAAVTFVITGKTGNFIESMRTAFTVVMFVTPFSLYTVFSFPLYRVSKRASRSGTAVVGDAASIEYSAPAFVTFNDTDVFSENNVWLDEIAMKDRESFSKGLAYASVVFEPISGPLNRLFAGAADYEVTTETVEYTDISDDGIEAVVNRERVRIGQASYFEKYGYALDDESRKNYRIMYVEIGNVIALKVKIVYNIDKDFEKILINLYKSGMGVVIRTSDPNINVNMIESIIGTGRFPIKVLKYRTESEKDIVRESTSGGIVSKGKVRPMLETLYRCDRAGAVIKSGLMLEMVAFVIGVITVSVLGGLGALGALSSIYVSLYHAFWSLLIAGLTLIFV